MSVKTYGPTPEAIDFLKLKLHSSKICSLDTIRIVSRSVEDHLWGMPWFRLKLTDFETTHRKFIDTNPKDRNLRLFVSYIPGPYVGRSETLAGLTYTSTSFSIIRSGCSDAIEGSTLLHEFGHLLSIDFGDREDKKRPSHCKNKECVMYWRITRPRKGFGKCCRKDLRKLIQDNR